MRGGSNLLRAPQQNVRPLAKNLNNSRMIRGGEQDGGQDSQQDPTKPHQQAHTLIKYNLKQLIQALSNNINNIT